MREPAAACIRLCDEVVALAPGPELESRALGHRGLGHLADYDPAAAQEWLDRAVGNVIFDQTGRSSSLSTRSAP